ncbi:hypothetical protein VCR3J2_350094 [Vibrio coralliirubri]|nr:hypothetical protein VCR4J2_750394 [Vibrio coralliirubri]CDT90468.1 hypothetical protein VCR3J2_350094 [Vibrio coralliirubri]
MFIRPILIQKHRFWTVMSNVEVFDDVRHQRHNNETACDYFSGER